MMDLDGFFDKQTILVVDDDTDNLHILSDILRPYYKVLSAFNGNVAIKMATSDEKPDLILLDTNMPDLDGYTVCKYLKQLPETSEIPIILVNPETELANEKKGFDLGAVDYITKPVSPSLVLARISAHLRLSDQKLHLKLLVNEKIADLEKTRMEIIQSLGRAAQFKDNETGMHVVRMSWYCYYLAKRATGNKNWSDLLRNAVPMHDIGKIGIPDAILLKPGKLDADEWVVMQKHVEYGVEILGYHETPLLALALEVVQFHHEKWDGSGYPNGISGENIPLSARITAIADVFDALTSERPHKKAWTVEKTMKLIESEAGRHFDPNLVPKFKACLGKFLEVKSLYKD